MPRCQLKSFFVKVHRKNQDVLHGVLVIINNVTDPKMNNQLVWSWQLIVRQRAERDLVMAFIYEACQNLKALLSCWHKSHVFRRQRVWKPYSVIFFELWFAHTGCIPRYCIAKAVTFLAIKIICPLAFSISYEIAQSMFYVI